MGGGFDVWEKLVDRLGPAPICKVDFDIGSFATSPFPCAICLETNKTGSVAHFFFLFLHS